MAILSHCLNLCFTACIFGSVYWRMCNLFPVMERQQRDSREAERQREQPQSLWGSRQQRERQQRD